VEECTERSREPRGENGALRRRCVHGGSAAGRYVRDSNILHETRVNGLKSFVVVFLKKKLTVLGFWNWEYHFRFLLADNSVNF